MGMDKVVAKYCNKLKKMLASKKTSSVVDDHHPSSCPVHCDDLFVAEKSGRSSTNQMDGNDLLEYHIAAQTHFSMRPNIYM